MRILYKQIEVDAVILYKPHVVCSMVQFMVTTLIRDICFFSIHVLIFVCCIFMLYMYVLYMCYYNVYVYFVNLCAIFVHSYLLAFNKMLNYRVRHSIRVLFYSIIHIPIIREHSLYYPGYMTTMCT